MPKFEVFWDEVITYSVLVEAEDEEDANIRMSDPAYWDSDPEISGNDFIGNVEIYEV
jgi:hypothetical protein